MSPDHGARLGPLEILGLAPAARHTGEGALHGPAAAQDFGGLDVFGFFHDLNGVRNSGFRELRSKPLATVAAFNPQPVTSAACASISMMTSGGVPALHTSRMDRDRDVPLPCQRGAARVAAARNKLLGKERDSPPGPEVREIQAQINVKNPDPVRSD